MPTRRSLLTATAIAPLAYASFAPAFADTPKSVVVMAMQIDDVISFDPAESYEFTDNEVDANCYRKLVVPDPQDGTKIAGDLAEKWDVSADGLTFTFHIREGATFASGKPVTAHDVEYSLNRVVMLNKSPGFILTQFGLTKDNVGKLLRATDDRTFTMVLPQIAATSFVLYCLSANVGCIVDKSEVSSHAANGDYGNAWLKTNTAGAGPLRLTSWAASSHIILDANPHAPATLGFKRLIINHVKDPSTQLLLLQKGDADIARNLTSDQLKTLKGSADYHFVSAAQAVSVYIAMNQNVKELAKPQVTQAIKWAIGYEAIAKNITPDTFAISQSFLPKGLPGALTEIVFKKDVAKAKQLLAEAGLAGGFTVSMDFVSDSPYNELAQAVQQDLAEIGIKLQLLPGEQKQVITKTRARTHQMAMLYWGSDYFDPNSNAQAFCADPDDGNDSKLKILAWRSHFADKKLTAQAEAAARELDSAKRIELYQTMQKEFQARAPFAMLLQRISVAVLRKNVSGFKLGPLPDYSKYDKITKT